MRDKPDDSEINADIESASTLFGALFDIADKYGARVTNNEPRWQNDIYLRDVCEFIDDVERVAKKFLVLGDEKC